MTNIKSCLLCKNYNTHPCECEHCEDWDNFRISESGKALREKIYGDGYQDGHKDGYDKGYDDAQANNNKPQGEIINKIPKDFVYDTETSEFYCYRNKYTGEEIHIVKSPKTYILARPQGEWEVKQCLDSEGNIAGYDVCCSECGKVLFHLMNRFSSVEEAKKYIKEEDFTNFCPDCGASMRKISKE